MKEEDDNHDDWMDDMDADDWEEYFSESEYDDP